MLFKKNSPNFIEQLYFEIIKAKLNLNYRFYLLKRYNQFSYKDDYKYKYIMRSKKICLKKKIYIFLSYNFPIITSKIKYFINKRK